MFQWMNFSVMMTERWSLKQERECKTNRNGDEKSLNATIGQSLATEGITEDISVFAGDKTPFNRKRNEIEESITTSTQVETKDETPS